MHDKPQGYKRQANALNICKNQGLSNLYQTEQEPAVYSPVWNKNGEVVGYKDNTGKFLDYRSLPVDDITGYPILPSLANVPYLFAEYGQNKSISGRHGKRIQIRKVRTYERPRAKYLTQNIGVGEPLDKQDGYSCALVTLDKPEKRRRAHNRHARVFVHTSEQITETRSSRRFRKETNHVA